MAQPQYLIFLKLENTEAAMNGVQVKSTMLHPQKQNTIQL